MPEFTASPKQSNPEPRVIRRGGVLLLFAAGLMLAALLSWLFFGTVRTSFTAFGVLSAGVDTRMIHYPAEGVVTDILVTTNQYVQKGDPLMLIYTSQPGKALSLEQMQEASEPVRAPVNGFVTEIIPRRWEPINLSTTLARMLESEKPVISYALTFLPLQEADRISVETEATVSLEGPTSLGAVISGKVCTISELPETEYEILYATGSEATARGFSSIGQQLIGVLVKLKTDENGLPEIEGVPAGKVRLICNEICKITFFSEEKHPWQILFNQ